MYHLDFHNCGCERLNVNLKYRVHIFPHYFYYYIWNHTKAILNCHMSFSCLTACYLCYTVHGMWLCPSKCSPKRSNLWNHNTRVICQKLDLNSNSANEAYLCTTTVNGGKPMVTQTLVQFELPFQKMGTTQRRKWFEF